MVLDLDLVKLQEKDIKDKKQDQVEELDVVLKVVKLHYTEVTLTMLNKSTVEEVDAATLLADGIIGKVRDGIVVLGTGSIEKKLTVKANRFTKSAGEKIVAAGGKIEVI